MARNSVTELPANSTRLQRVLSDVDALRADTVSIDIETLWDPWRCPADLLPFLAWAVSVDVWNEDWPEQIQRDVIAAAPNVHRLKGTVKAVRDALGPFGMFPRIREWWQTTPQGRRGTFHVRVFINDIKFPDQPYLGPEQLLLAKAAVKAAKPKSRVFDIDLGMGLESGVAGAAGAAGVSGSLHSATLEPRLDTAATVAAASGLAGISAVQLFCEVTR